MWDEFFVTKRKTNLTNLCSLSTHEEGYRDTAFLSVILISIYRNEADIWMMHKAINTSLNHKNSRSVEAVGIEHKFKKI